MSRSERGRGRGRKRKREYDKKEDATLVSQHPNTELKGVRLVDTSTII